MSHHTHPSHQLHTNTHTHPSTLLTYSPQKKRVLVLTTTLWITMTQAPFSHSGRQGRPATQSDPSLALIITRGPLQRESGSPGPEIVARKRLYRPRSLCNPILIQACILLSWWEKCSSGLSKKACVSVNACQRARSETHAHKYWNTVAQISLWWEGASWLMSLS